MRLLQTVSKLAWRNLWRNHRRTIIMVGAITLGVWAMIFMTALIRGMVDNMITDGLRALPGHVQVHHPAFRDDPSVENLIGVSDAEIRRRFESTDIESWASRVKVPAVITSERESRGIVLFGIDPAREVGISFVADDMSDGRFLEDESDSGIVIGAKLADTLETEVGKRVVLMSQDPDNEVADRGFRVVGLFDASLDAFEETMVFAGKETLQRMLKIGDAVSEVAVQGDDYRDVTALTDEVRQLFSGNEEVLPWAELDSYLGSMLDVMDGFVLVWMVVIFMALSFGLVNTLVMAVFERVREIGLMMALGMRPGSILAQIVVESILLLLVGLLFGNLIAYASIEPLKTGIDVSIVAEGMEMMGVSTVLYPKMMLKDVLLANAVVLVLGFLASLSPAWRASRYEPIEAITKV
ncbi:MAG: ABC transporter permease [Gammaproteobacteria bacterium]|nr:ABC transporter permease [Gammaproteobacteria bacterium]